MCHSGGATKRISSLNKTPVTCCAKKQYLAALQESRDDICIS